MIEYQNLVRRILDAGEDVPDRTGTGTRSIFGHQMRFDLARGFPLVTTKRTFFRGAFEEMLWMLRGETNVRPLQAKGVHIWDEWADETGDLGPVYGAQWVGWGAKKRKVPQRPPVLREGLRATYLGVANGAGKEGHPLKKTWEGMIARCYDPKNIGYSDYGGRGVSVCDSWLEFTAFAKDAEHLPGYEKKAAGERMALDKDINGSGFLYSPEVCAWVTDSDNQLARSTRVFTVEGPDGKTYTFTNPANFCRQHGICDKNFSDLWTGRKNAKARSGFRLVDVEDTSQGVNQLCALLHGLKHNPHSRRHILSAWNPAELPAPGVHPTEQAVQGRMALAPCHCLAQFHVSRSGRFSCQLYQRSADVFLGVPFNLAGYALLTHLLAHHLGYDPGEFVWTGGDCHLYTNHLDKAEKLLGRNPLPLPNLVMTHAPDTPIWEVTTDTLHLVGYDPHPAIPAEVSV